MLGSELAGLGSVLPALGSDFATLDSETLALVSEAVGLESETLEVGSEVALAKPRGFASGCEVKSLEAVLVVLDVLTLASVELGVGAEPLLGGLDPLTGPEVEGSTFRSASWFELMLVSELSVPTFRPVESPRNSLM